MVQMKWKAQKLKVEILYFNSILRIATQTDGGFLVKLFLHCDACFGEFFDQLTSGALTDSEKCREAVTKMAAHEIEANDKSTYRVDCGQHGERNIVLFTQRFEILFQIGLNAILDGYYREAVMSFSSSLERFYEYYLRIVAVDNKLAKDMFDDLWKRRFIKWSERQLGAFNVVYMLKNESIPPALNDQSSKLRNDVAHKGKIPSRDEANDCGEEILSIIVPILSNLRTNFKVAIETCDKDLLDELRKEVPNDADIVLNGSIHLVFGPSKADPNANAGMSKKLDLIHSWRSGHVFMNRFLKPNAAER